MPRLARLRAGHQLLHVLCRDPRYLELRQPSTPLLAAR